jgi:hypothetical protein
MRIEKFIGRAHAALISGASVPEVMANDAMDVINQCLGKSQYLSPDSFIASWLLLELFDNEHLRRKEQPDLLAAEVAAATIAAGNPIKNACGALYWMWGDGVSEEEWRKPGTNPEHGDLSDRDCLLLGFGENADVVLPAMRRVRHLGLHYGHFDDFASAEETVSKVARTGAASAYDNELLCIRMMRVHERLTTLVDERHGISIIAELGNRTRDRSVSHLLKWPNVPPEEITPHVATLSSILAVKRGAFELVGPVMRALTGWEKSSYSQWAAQSMSRAIEGSRSDYERFVKSLPPRIEVEKSESTGHRRLNQEARSALMRWYTSSDGTDRIERINQLFKVARVCKKALELDKKDDVLSDDHLSRLPVEARRLWDAALEQLGTELSAQWMQILNMKTPRIAAYASWLHEHRLLDRLWARKTVNSYIRYTYRLSSPYR